jgi:hypothetical protein
MNFYQRYNAFQIAHRLTVAEAEFATDPDFGMAIYERAINEVNDSNRSLVAEMLKAMGSEIEVLSSNV